MTTLMAIKVPSAHLIPNDEALVTYVEHGVIMAADTRFIRDLSKKELQRVFQDNVYSMPIGLRQRDKEAAELRGLPYDPSKPVEIRLGDLGLQACLSVDYVSEMYRLRGGPEVGGKVQVRVITSDGIKNVRYATLDTAGGRDVLEHRTPTGAPNQ